jgi:hypothetical protein
MNPQKETSNIIQKVREYEADVRQQKREEEHEHQFDLPAAVRTFKAYKKWYCRKNQPHNYIRLTCRRPTDVADHRPFWICRLQAFAGGKNGGRLLDDIRITAEAYELFPFHMWPGWGEKEEQDFYYEWRIYKNPALCPGKE